MKKRLRQSSFTLIELLIVIAIIAILAAMLLPALNRAREVAKGLQCVSNKKQAMLAQVQYASDFNGFMVGFLPGNSNYGLWGAVLCNSQDNSGLYSINGKGYLAKGCIQCPSARNRNKPGDSNFQFWYSTYGIDYSYYNNNPMDSNRSRIFGEYILSSDSPELYLFVLGKMKRTSDILIFADTLWLKNNTPIPRFFFNARLDTGAVVQAHQGRTSAAFADGHAAMHSGLELKNLPYNLQYWYNNMGGAIGQ